MMLELVIDRPVAGGRMLTRHQGRVVLVAGAIPGERVRARVERVSRQVMWAVAEEIIEASPDRREPVCDPACGGAWYAHVRYERQLQLKAAVIADAFRRIGRIDLPRPTPVAASPERAYRLRARLHVQNGRVGFFREGSHTLCDAAATGQLHPDALTATETLAAAVPRHLANCDSIIVSENVDATARVLHLVPRDGARLEDLQGVIPSVPHVTGVTTERRGRPVTLGGTPSVTDSAATLFGDEPVVDPSATWTRHAMSFFQANRFLLGTLVQCVLRASDGEACLDLYSGVGLFGVALAAAGHRVIAVEGDHNSAADLRANAAPWQARMHIVCAAVEAFVRTPPVERPDVVVLDPPRAGASTGLLDALIRWAPPRLVYVSCDPPTLARDAARLVAGRYRLESLEAFDLFPNTAHVEAVAVFRRE